MKKNVFLFFLFFSLILAPACSKSDRDEPQPPETEVPEEPKPEEPGKPTEPEEPEKPEEPETPEEPEMPAKKELKIFQINTWMECGTVPKGYSGLVGQIVALDPDIILLCELQNRGQSFVEKLSNTLSYSQKRYQYRIRPTDAAPKSETGVISKYPITDITTVNSGLKVGLNVNGQRVVVYSMHLNYLYYACYYPRGYDGNTWQEMEAPITDIDKILANNLASGRPAAIRSVIANAKTESDAGAFVFVGGDFNEPSHLDWTQETSQLWDHNGCVVPWHCSVLLGEAGFTDSYRKLYPDPVQAPGFTFPSANPAVPISNLSWAPKADERDRIDFIYYHKNNRLTLLEAAIVGPNRSIAYAQETEERTSDRFIAPAGVWTTDHKGTLAVFKYE